jgi:AcrR family transcriptional regulator
MPGSRIPAPTPRRMSSDARRRQLLEVALELFAERGYHATSISHMIERADVARGTFYQ